MSLHRPHGLPGRPARHTPGLAGAAAALLALAAAAVIAQAPHRLLGQAAPDFTLRAAAGANVRLDEHLGEVVVLSFWSAGCATCRAQLAALDRSLRTYASAGLSIYGIGVDDRPQRALEFARGARVGFPMLLDPEKSMGRAYDVDNLPMTVLIDRGGTVRYVLRDYDARSEALYLRQLRALLNE